MIDNVVKRMQELCDILAAVNYTAVDNQETTYELYKLAPKLCDAYIQLQIANENLLEALERLARLGNGSHYGNSLGNSIAQVAIKQHKETL